MKRCQKWIWIGMVAAGVCAAADLKPDFADLSYGPYKGNQLDLWLARRQGPAPLVVFIHGGGFVSGDKSKVNPQIVRQCLDAGAAFASINYRFRTEVPIQVVLRDSARAIQFLRWKAAQYGLDKTRVASFGGSAGAGTSLWLAFHDDLADAHNSDPVLRESTRLRAAGSNSGQATYDILKWPEILGDPSVMRFYPESEGPKLYGLRSVEELRQARGARIRADVDMITMITKDDPPVYLVASHLHDNLRNLGDVNHTPLHSIAIKKRCDEVGVEAVLRIVDGAPGDAAKGESMTDFLLRKLRIGAK